MIAAMFRYTPLMTCAIADAALPRCHADMLLRAMLRASADISLFRRRLRAADDAFDADAAMATALPAPLATPMPSMLYVSFDLIYDLFADAAFCRHTLSRH